MRTRVCMQACEYVHVRCFKSAANVDMEAKKGVYMYGLVGAALRVRGSGAVTTHKRRCGRYEQPSGT